MQFVSKRLVKVGGRMKIEWDEIKRFALLAEKVYHQTESDDVLFRGFSFEEIKLKELEEKAFVLTSEKEQIISIRGTTNIKNAVRDIEFWKSKDKRLGIYLHKGFKKVAQALYVKLPKISKRKDIYIVGHSLGGAVAVILAMYLKADGINPKKIITFGQPKVTDKNGINKYKDLNLLRIVHDNDPVPLTPPWTFFAPFTIYRHFGLELLLPDGNSMWKVYSDKDYSTAGSWETWRRIARGKLGIEEVKDHFMDNYLKIINKFGDF